MYSCIMDIKFKKILLVYALQTNLLDLVGNNHMHLHLCQESIVYTILYYIFAYVCNFWLAQLRDSFHLKHGMQNRCLITIYFTITQTLITSFSVLNCITELYTEILIWTFLRFSYQRVIKSIILTGIDFQIFQTEPLRVVTFVFVSPKYYHRLLGLVIYR